MTKVLCKDLIFHCKLITYFLNIISKHSYHYEINESLPIRYKLITSNLVSTQLKIWSVNKESNYMQNIKNKRYDMTPCN